jgi:putative ABC transport system permease protein
MTAELPLPSWPGVATSLLFVALVTALAARQRLHLTGELLIAALRAGAQLVAIGAVLLVIFAHAGLLGAFAWVAIMVIIAGQVAGRRGKGVPRARVAATIGVGTGSLTVLAALFVLDVLPTQPRVVVPVAGMIVATAMQATGLTLRRLREDAHTARPAIEARLCLGLPARQAFLPHQRSALRTALLPAIDSTKVVGLISLPGAMTGLILAGVDPLVAIRYQIVVMYMLLAATALAALVTARLAEHALFDHAHRLVQLPEPST